MPPAPNEPHAPSHRWAALVLLSSAMFGGLYVFDSIGPLAKVLSTQLNFSDSDIGFLQALCSFPNIFMVLLGGVILDRIGVRKAGLLFSLLCLVGAVTTAASPHLSAMAMGRLVFGIGIGSLSVVTTAGIAQWFRGSHLGFAFAINLTINRLGSLVAQVGPTWAKDAYASWRTPLWIAVAFALFGTLCMVAYWGLEHRARVRHSDPGPAAGSSRTWGLGREYRLLVLICVTFYAGIFPFQTFAQKFFVDARGVTAAQASLMVGALTVIAMVMTPLCGILEDRMGHRTPLLVLGCAFLAPVYLLMAHTQLPLWVPMGLMGLAYSVVPAVIWPSVMPLVPQESLGKAFGLMTMVQSIGLTGFNYLAGRINDLSGAGPSHPQGYAPGMWLFSLSSVLALILSIMLWRFERRSSSASEAHCPQALSRRQA